MGRVYPVEATFETIRKLNPLSEVHLYDAGHFALDEQSDEIARQIVAFFAH
jgi:pimeloyl-ACP methyl ester carboxylesterase